MLHFFYSNREGSQSPAVPRKKHESHLMGARAGRFCERQCAHGRTTPPMLNLSPPSFFVGDFENLQPVPSAISHARYESG